MSMNYEDMLAAAEDKQSYHLLDELPNEYNGKDTLGQLSGNPRPFNDRDESVTPARIYCML